MRSDEHIVISAAQANYDRFVPGDVAVFDLDGTLTVRDAVVPFLLKAGGRGRAAVQLPRVLVPIVGAWLRKDRDRAKAIATNAMLRSVARGRIDEAAQSIAKRIASGWMREDVLARLRWHQSAGHHTVIVSASYQNYVSLVGEALHVDHVIATEVGFDESERCTGELVGGNCRGQAKADRLTAYLENFAAGQEIGWCYGDSSGDDAMMALARNAVSVRGVDIDPAPNDVEVV